jgi:hypothetical protein
MVSLSLWVVDYVCEAARWCHSKNENRTGCEESDVYYFLYLKEGVDRRIPPKRSELQPRLFHLRYSSRVAMRKKRDKPRKQGGTFMYTWITQKVMMVAKSKKNSITKALYAVLIHLILLIWVHVTFSSLEWRRKKWRIANFA